MQEDKHLATAPRFNPALESLRGLAALGVCLAHCIGVLRLDGQPRIYMVPIWHQSPPTALLSLLSALLSPHNAVILFFLLSGYVLAQSFEKRHHNLGVFYSRRALRILPAMWAALLLAYAAAAIDHTPNQPVSDWYLGFFEPPPTLRDLARNWVLIDFHVNAVTWTMRIELLGSLLMPLLVLIVQRGTRVIHCAALLLLMGLVVATLTDFRYLLCFYVGALLTRYQLPRSASLLWLGLAASAALQLSGLQFSHSGISVLIGIMASTAILGGVLGTKPAFLETAPLRFLGRISYSLYLLHPTVLGLCAVALFAVAALPPLMGTVLLIVVSLPIAAAAAAASHRWIELRFMALKFARTNTPAPAENSGERKVFERRNNTVM